MKIVFISEPSDQEMFGKFDKDVSKQNKYEKHLCLKIYEFDHYGLRLFC